MPASGRYRLGRDFLPPEADPPPEGKVEADFLPKEARKELFDRLAPSSIG